MTAVLPGLGVAYSRVRPTRVARKLTLEYVVTVVAMDSIESKRCLESVAAPTPAPLSRQENIIFDV